MLGIYRHDSIEDGGQLRALARLTSPTWRHLADFFGIIQPSPLDPRFCNQNLTMSLPPVEPTSTTASGQTGIQSPVWLRYATVKQKLPGSTPKLRISVAWRHDATRGHGGDKQEQQSVGRDVHVEIHGAV